MSKYKSANVCSKHPELEGLRWTSNRKCVKCDAERVAERLRKRRTDDEYRKAENARMARARREKYQSDPLFREKEKERCRAATAVRRAAQKAALSLARETSGDQSRTIVPPVPPVV